MEESVRLSIVIATLAGPQLQETIASINNSTIVPDEILVCVPEKEVHDKKLTNSGNVQIISTKVRGQVAQRCEGFKIAKGELVIQLDDDIILESDCISLLIASIKQLGSKAVCSPAFFFKETGKSVYQRPITSRWLSGVYYWLLNGNNGYVEGVITKAGTEIGINPAHHRDNIIQTEWVPGGMAIHYRENLVTENYFPHKGKAFSEDIYHSFELTRKGLSLYLITQARAYIDDPRTQDLMSIKAWWMNMKKDYTTRKYFIQLANKSYLRMLCFYAFSLLAYVLKFCKKKLRVGV